jgi:cobalamin biosynthesis protein CobT
MEVLKVIKEIYKDEKYASEFAIEEEKPKDDKTTDDKGTTEDKPKTDAEAEKGKTEAEGGEAHDGGAADAETKPEVKEGDKGDEKGKKEDDKVTEGAGYPLALLAAVLKEKVFADLLKRAVVDLELDNLDPLNFNKWGAALNPLQFVMP